jgi:hypothetical protein
MKPWAWTAVAVVVGYLAYNQWFASDEEEPNEPVVRLESPIEEAAVPQGPEEPPQEGAPDAPRLSLDTEGAPAVARGGEDPAGELEAKLRDARRTGDGTAAGELAGQILAQHPESDAARVLRFEKGREHLALYRREGRNKEGLRHAHEARRHLTPALFLSGADAGDRKELRKTLAELADDVLFTARHVEGSDFLYTPRAGDYLEKLCRDVFPGRGARTTPGFVLSVNGLTSPKQLRAAEPIKVPLGEPTVVVVKGEFRLYYLLDGAYVRDFPVGLGRKGSTPEAAFKVRLKQKNPDWYPEPGKRVPFGDPANILGTRWIGFESSAEYRGFGIHGTVDPTSVGREESSGCVRMLQADVELLYDWIPEGTTVVIRR